MGGGGAGRAVVKDMVLTGPGIVWDPGLGIKGRRCSVNIAREERDVIFFRTDTHSFSHRPTIL